MGLTLPLNSRAKAAAKALRSFFAAQLFFALMMISFTFGGPVAFGVIIGIPPLLAWFGGNKKSYYFIFYFICMTLVIGQRTLYIGQYTRLVPAELLLYILAMSCAFIKSRFPLKNGPLPWTVLTLAVFSGIAIRMAADHNFYEADLSFAFGYAHMMWMAIPAFLVCHRLIHRLDHVQTFMTLLAMGCLFLSFLALSEYFHLPYIKLFGRFVSTVDEAKMTGYEGFRRLGGSFWGGPMLAGYLCLCFPLIMTQFINSKTTIQKALYAFSLLLSFLTIYFSGHRGLWLPLLIAIGSYFALKGIRGILILILLATIGYVAMPQEAKVRMETVYGEKRDSSSEEREKRAQDAWNMIKGNPVIGYGWGSSGLVHSDILQLWADAGLGAVAPLVLLWIQILFRLSRALKAAKIKILKEYCYGFFASVTGSVLMLAFQAWFNLPEQYAPFWIVTALAYHYPNVISIEMRLLQAEAQAAQKKTPEGIRHA